MTFSEVEKRYVILKNQLNSKQITPQQFNAMVDQLRFQDKQGKWWQKRADGQWMVWNGSTWAAASPPEHRSSVTSQDGAIVAPSSSQAPQTLFQLLKMVLKGMLKGLLKKIPLSIGIALLTLILHTYLLVGPNGGFDSGTNATLDSVLALRGRMVSGTLFWTLLTGIFSVIFARFRQAGIKGTLRNIRTTPDWVMNAFRVEGSLAFGILLAGVALTLLIGSRLGNRLVSLQLAIAAIGALIAQRESLSYMVVNATWGDAHRLLKRPPTHFKPTWASAGIAGVILGFSWLTLVPMRTFMGCAGGLILLGAAIALVLIQKNKSELGITLLLLGIILSLALVVTPAFADDGGWDEAGGTFSSWSTTSGAAQAVAQGVPPSVGAAVGALVGSSLVGAAGVASGGGSPIPVPVPKPKPQVPVTPVPPVPVQPPTPPSILPDDPWEQKWINNGWKWSEEDDGFIPQSGAINEDNQVWCQPPWDQGGEYWVDEAEYDDIQEHLSNGDEWSDRWGWKPPEEINQLDQARDERWKKFTDPAESQKRHDQMMKRIEQDLANDPHHQKIMMEFEKIQQRLDDAKRQSLRDDIDYNQKVADYYNNQADMYDKLHTGASVVKSGADFAIDVIGMAPGGGRYVKYTYKFVSNTAQTSIETGSISQGLTKGVIETGKAVIGDKIGGELSIPGVDEPTVWAKIPVKDFVKKVASSPYDAKQLVLNKIVDSKISDGLNRFENGVHSIIDNPED